MTLLEDPAFVADLKALLKKHHGEGPINVLLLTVEKNSDTGGTISMAEITSNSRLLNPTSVKEVLANAAKIIDADIDGGRWAKGRDGEEGAFDA